MGELVSPLSRSSFYKIFAFVPAHKISEALQNHFHGQPIYFNLLHFLEVHLLSIYCRFTGNSIVERLNIQSILNSNNTHINMTLIQLTTSEPVLNTTRSVKPKNNFYLKEPSIFASKCWENPCQNRTDFTIGE